MENNSSSVKEKDRTFIKNIFSDMIWISVDTFTLGSDSHYPEESLSHKTAVNGFWMDKYPFTNKEFKNFVDETNYVSVAERFINPEDYPEIPPGFLVSGSLVFTRVVGEKNSSCCTGKNAG